MSGDVIVALLGVVMAAVILSRNSALRSLPWERKALYALVWAAIFAIGALAFGGLRG